MPRKPLSQSPKKYVPHNKEGKHESAQDVDECHSLHALSGEDEPVHQGHAPCMGTGLRLSTIGFPAGLHAYDSDVMLYGVCHDPWIYSELFRSSCSKAAASSPVGSPKQLTKQRRLL